MEICPIGIFEIEFDKSLFYEPITLNYLERASISTFDSNQMLIFKNLINSINIFPLLNLNYLKNLLKNNPKLFIEILKSFLLQQQALLQRKEEHLQGKEEHLLQQQQALLQGKEEHLQVGGGSFGLGLFLETLLLSALNLINIKIIETIFNDIINNTTSARPSKGKDEKCIKIEFLIQYFVKCKNELKSSKSLIEIENRIQFILSTFYQIILNNSIYVETKNKQSLVLNMYLSEFCLENITNKISSLLYALLKRSC